MEENNSRTESNGRAAAIGAAGPVSRGASSGGHEARGGVREARGRIYLPADPLNPAETELKMSINGRTHRFVLGKLTDAPESFCRLAVASGRADGYEPLGEEVPHD